MGETGLQIVQFSSEITVNLFCVLYVNHMDVAVTTLLNWLISCFSPVFCTACCLVLLLILTLCCSLAPLVKKVGEPRVVEMTNKLCDNLLNGKDQHRDIASIALKTIIAEITTPSLAQSILISLSPQLIRGITGPVSF